MLDSAAVYGLLTVVGIKANLTQTLEGPRIMVFEWDARIARAVLNS